MSAVKQPLSMTTRVVAANKDIKLGNILTADNLTTIEVGTVPAGAFLAKDQSKVINRGVISDLYQNEPIIESRLAALGSGGGLAATIPPGMRACAVKVDDVVNVSGFVTPGMRVDVLVSGVPPGAQNTNQGTVAKTLLQNIRVLSTGTDIEKDATGKAKQVQVVNLLVTPEQAESLSLTSNLSIRLVLRNPLDTNVAPVSGTTTGSIFSGMTPEPEKPHTVVKSAPAPAYSIEVDNGSTATQEKFASAEGHK